MARHKFLNPNGIQLYAQYKKRSKRKGITFDITKEEFLTITQKCCYICNAPPSQKYVHSYKSASLARTPFMYNGLDRVDNKLGYQMGNVMACCGTCNHAKKAQSLNKFLQYIRRCYKVAIEPYLKGEPPDAET